jgi:hypothetical protein
MGADLHKTPWGTFCGEKTSEIHLPCGCKFAGYNGEPPIAQWCTRHGAAEEALQALAIAVRSGDLVGASAQRAMDVLAWADTPHRYAQFPSSQRGR